MATLRCYLPLSPEQLDTLRTDRRLTGPLRATTVTRSVRASLPSGDQDEWEYAALQAAALGLSADGQPVIVAAVDLVQETVDAARPEGPQVRVGDVDLPRVAAFHLGDDVVTGDPATLPAPDEEIELSWYDTTELEQVIELAHALVEGQRD
ncbi:DUF6912 family protein [Ornithinimicrobium sufpigmenti]|uniref:DUF6912 family protein n=1 Tax=Ornithinimicrobium sufpigmenti TaxID=2508882 RepID=UPI001036925F|nr:MULTISPECIES: hypothetical protein [unclassified Ornithinimicrobium]